MAVMQTDPNIQYEKHLFMAIFHFNLSYRPAYHQDLQLTAGPKHH